MARIALLSSAMTAAACGPPEWVRANAASSSGFLSVHGSGPRDVWAVGDVGAISHFDGNGWKALDPVTSVHLHAVAAVSTTDAWAVGDQGTVLRWNGTVWTKLNITVTSTLLQVVAVAANDVWILPKDSHELLHWDGASLSRVDATTRSGYGVCLWGNSAANLWLMPSSTNHAYRVTTAGVFEVPLDISGSFDCAAISGQGPDDVWFLSDEVLLHYDGKLFRPTAPPKNTDLFSYSTFYMRGIFATARDEAWVVGTTGGIFHVLGQSWTVSVKNGASGAANLNSVWGARTDDLWSAGAAGAMFRRSTPEVAP